MNTRSILLIEDNPGDIGFPRRAPEKNHIANPLMVCEDGQEAFDFLFGADGQPAREAGDLPALILLDLKLPRIDGMELLRRIRNDERTRRLPVVILTTSGERQDIAQSYDLGANSCLRKPVGFTQFTHTDQQSGLYWLIRNEPPSPKVIP